MIRRNELTISSREVLGFDDGLGAASEQLRSVRSELAGEPVEPVDELVVELNQDLLACDDHIVLHMVR